MGANALADLDGDGNLDLLTGTAYMLGDGAGGFRERTQLESAPIMDVVVADFDLDGHPDLALGPRAGNEIIVLFGRQADQAGANLFEAPLLLPSVLSPWHLIAVDLDEDGDDDIVAIQFADRAFAVHINDGDRTFQPFVELQTPAPIPLWSVAAGDFDGDGHVDIALAGDTKAVVYFGDGTGALRPTAVGDTVTKAGSVIIVHRIEAADLEGDGRSEMLAVGVTRGFEDRGSVFGYWGSEIRADTGLPARTSFDFELPGGGRFLEVADMNGDRTLDLVAQGERETSFIKIFYGVTEGGFSFEPSPEFMTDLSGHGSVLAVGDVDSDGAVDIVLTTEDSSLGDVLLNDRGCLPDEAAQGDANVDGHLDIADVVKILSHLFARGALPCRPNADANGDGERNIADPIFLLQHLFAKGPPPPAGTVSCRE